MVEAFIFEDPGRPNWAELESARLLGFGVGRRLLVLFDMVKQNGGEKFYIYSLNEFRRRQGFLPLGPPRSPSRPDWRICDRWQGNSGRSHRLRVLVNHHRRSPQGSGDRVGPDLTAGKWQHSR